MKRCPIDNKPERNIKREKIVCGKCGKSGHWRSELCGKCVSRKHQAEIYKSNGSGYRVYSKP